MIRLFKHYIPNAVLLLGLLDIVLLVVAGELGWDASRLEDEVDHYLRRVEAERQSQQMLTDHEADEARVSAPDIV